MTDEAPVDDGLAEFRNIVEGIVNDVFACTQARDLDLTIGLFATEINGAGYGPLFWAVQAMASRDMALSMRKIFDNDGRHRQRTIPKALEWIEKNEKLILGHDNIHERMGGCRGLCEALEEIRDSLPGKKEVRHPQICECLSCSFDRVKTMADKEVAHNEVYVNADRPKYEDIDRLIDGIIKSFFRELAGAILNTCYVSDDGSFLIPGYAGGASNAFRRLMQDKFGLTPEEAFNRNIA